MKGTVPKRSTLRSVPPPCTIRVIGDGWTRYGSATRKISDRIYHSERWISPDQNGQYKNIIARRKNKRDFPEYEPIVSAPPV